MVKIIIYDGVCGVCNNWVQFILKNNPDPEIRFVSFQSKVSKPYREKFEIVNMDSLLLIENEKCYRQSTAILKIFKLLNSNWKYIYSFIYIPRVIRDFFYNHISKNRYFLMGKRENCKILTSKDKSFFLE